MEINDKVTQLENEIKVLKNEVQAVLLDIKDNILNSENPFNASKVVTPGQHIILQTSTPPRVPNSGETNINVNSHLDNVGKTSEGRHANVVETHANEYDNREFLHHDKKPGTAANQGDLINKPTAPTFQPVTNENHEKKQPSNLIKYAALTSWVESSLKQFGPERTRVMLEISEIAGLLPNDVVQILIRLTNIPTDEKTLNLTAKEYFRSLTRIANISGNEDEYNTALLQVLTNGDVDG